MYSREEAKQVRKEFWESFSNYTIFFSRKIGEPIKWMLYKTEIKGVELKFEVERKEIRVVLELNAKNENRKFDIYVELDKFRKIIEDGFDKRLIWEEEYMLPEGKNVSRIYVELSGITYLDKDKWPEIFRFMTENMYQLQTNFELIHDILKGKFGK